MTKRFQAPCIDVYSPMDFKNADQSLVFSAITLTDAIWKPGSKGKITITFGSNGCPGCSPEAAWSNIGNQSSSQVPSMNLGFIDPPFEPFTFKGKTYKATDYDQRNYCGIDNSRKFLKSTCDSKWKPGATVIHEFCHALGMLHEHQNNLENSNEIKLNPENVVRYYQSIGLGPEDAEVNVLERYTCEKGEDCEYSGTKYDKDSIMLYALPDDWVIGENPTYPNFTLSKDDKAWLQNIYPKDTNNPPTISVEFIDKNDEPWKRAWVEKVVRETFEPLIGINWDFKNSVNSFSKQMENTVDSEESSSEPIIPTQNTTEQIGSLSTIEITAIVLGCIIFLIFVFSFFYKDP